MLLHSHSIPLLPAPALPLSRPSSSVSVLISSRPPPAHSHLPMHLPASPSSSHPYHLYPLFLWLLIPSPFLDLLTPPIPFYPLISSLHLRIRVVFYLHHHLRSPFSLSILLIVVVVVSSDLQRQGGRGTGRGGVVGSPSPQETATPGGWPTCLCILCDSASVY